MHRIQVMYEACRINGRWKLPSPCSQHTVAISGYESGVQSRFNYRCDVYVGAKSFQNY